MAKHVHAFRSAAAILLIAAAAAHADGPGAYRWIDKPPQSGAPELSAIDAYNAGYADIQRADALDAAIAQTTDRGEQRKIEREAQSAYKAALKRFNEATRQDPLMHEAHTYIGYANRKLGRYDASLKAYAEALRINPDYPHAIEYQGQAYLGLNRIDDAKFNYLRLYAIAPNQAAKLLAAMQRWAMENESDARHQQTATDLKAWIATRPPVTTDSGAVSSW
ncbi:tetratricopeptide (TPR) repeat protein [Povalibacter uvarum]|uniref:Tetratricopeptide (TPR) repeat protein n=1 Tax=Povalibacter uvarum TaxID=732238 RepID=A0A841HP94_9GAMM|nr:tetratricopeptide repeat protein [Povalibacter uvarum]MBB6094159.1 tetratricopeptide (TPR) repeat protein [Povalibacter uvarum]